jgi:hypothetical protein
MKLTDHIVQKEGIDDASGTLSHLGHLKEKSLKIAGYAYLIGDAALFGSGITAKPANYKDALVGLSWGLGGMAAARYGNPAADKQLKMLNHDLGNYLRNHGVAIPQNPTTADLAKEGGLIDKIETFLYTYPSQSLNAVYGGFASLLTYSGIKGKNPSKTVTGALIMAGGLAGLLIQEKKPDPAHPPQGVVEKAWSWAQEKPLRISGTLYGLSNIGLVMTAFKAKSQHPSEKTSYSLLFLTAASYIFANTMLRFSSKDHGGAGDVKAANQAMEALANESAAVIAAQPPEVQETLVKNIADHMAESSFVKMSSDEIAGLLTTKLASMTQTQPPLAKNWQERIAGREALSPSL